jgi:hypothetical protein
VVIRNQFDLDAFLKGSPEDRYELIHVADVTSPPPVLQYFSQPPPVFTIDENESARSEGSSKSVQERDGHSCKIPGCGMRDTQTCHIIDKKIAFMSTCLAKGNDDINNLILLCYSHHAAFDAYYIVFVPVTSSPDCRQFVVHFGFGIDATDRPDLAKYVGQVIEFDDHDHSPVPQLFLMKQLGRFKVRCAICKNTFERTGLASHWASAHQTFGSCPENPLPHVECDHKFDRTKLISIYNHLMTEHRYWIYTSYAVLVLVVD